jgi:release factor glutamine methyltransferase
MRHEYPAAGMPRSASPPATLQQAIRSLATSFREAGLETPDLDARRLVLDGLSLDSAALLREPDRRLDAAELKRINEAHARRLAREPVSRILGRRAFHGLDFEITAETLDPRPDTETLVDGVLQLVADGRVPGGDAPRILDIGTGSGAILIALLDKLAKATGLGTDISEAALEVARRNAAACGLTDRACFQHANWLGGVEGPFDLVVSNPPYIRSGDLAGLEAEVADFDPVTALDGGPDGLSAYRSLANGLPRILAPGGWVAIEVGIGQSDDVASILANSLNHGRDEADGDVLVWFDLGGIARCVAREARI